MEFKQMIIASLILLSPFACAENNQETESSSKHPASYVEFLQSITIAGEEVLINIPAKFDLATQEMNVSQQTLGFVLDGESINDWSEYIGVNISMNTDMSVRTRIEMIEEHLERSYQSVKTISTDFDNIVTKDGRNYQVAKATFLFNDEQGPVTSSVICYSDFNTLVGTQVNIRSAKHSGRATSAAKKLVNQVIQVQS